MFGFTDILNEPNRFSGYWAEGRDEQTHTLWSRVHYQYVPDVAVRNNYSKLLLICCDEFTVHR